MKFTVLGFSQPKLIEFGLDLTDALILRYFIDFKDSGEMVMEIVNNQPFYWVNYKELMKNIPIIGIKSADALRRRLRKMQQCNILEHYHKNQGGSYSFYGIGTSYKELLKPYKDSATQKSEGCDSKVEGGATQKSGGCDSKVGGDATQKSEQNINLLKDTSIKDTSIKTTTNKDKDVVVVSDEQIDILRNKTGLSIKDCTTLLKKEQTIARIVALFNYASSKTNVKNIVGYIIRLLDNGFEIPVSNNFDDYYSDIGIVG